MKTIIHVNRQKIAQNRNTGDSRPVITVKDYRRNRYGSHVEILGPSRVVQAGKCGIKPLRCGARVWIETESEVRVK